MPPVLPARMIALVRRGFTLIELGLCLALIGVKGNGTASRDDILRANNGRFVGPASMY